MMRRLLVLALAVALLVSLPAPVRAVLSSQDNKTLTRVYAPGEALEARQYRLPETRVAGQEYVRQSVTIWEVTAGTWNGQSLKGLILVLVRSTSDVGPSRPMTNCYVSHFASAAQREALLGAFVAAQSLAPGEVASWRVEPAVIRFDMAGPTLVVHLGLVA